MKVDIMNKMILLFWLFGICNAAIYYGSLQNGTQYPIQPNINLNSSECLYVFENDSLITIPNVITMLQGGTPIGFLYKTCAIQFQQPTISATIQQNQTYVNGSISVSCLSVPACMNFTNNITSFMQANATSPLLWFGQNWTEPNSNVTCVGPQKMLGSINVDYGTTLNNFNDTGLTIVGPPICPPQITCPVCQQCQVCPPEKICDVCHFINGNVELNDSTPNYVNADLNGSIFFRPKALSTMFASNGSCNSTVTLAGTNLSYCPSRITALCSDQQKISGDFETCINDLANTSTEAKIKCENDKAATDELLRRCTSGETIQQQNTDAQMAVAGVFLFIFGLGIIIVFVMKRKKDTGD